MSKTKIETIFKTEPEEHDFPAAQDYLELLMPPELAAQKVAQLRKAVGVNKMSKDILRASRLPMLPKDNAHVAADLKKIKAGKPLSPILLVRGSTERLIIADGYHRVCAAWYLAEDQEIPCRLV